MVPDRADEIGLGSNPIDHLKNSRLGLHIDARERVFSFEETVAYLQAAKELPHPYGTCLRLLIETGQRLGVVSGLRWSQINFDRRLWTIPSSRSPSAKPGRTSKKGGAIELPLSDSVNEFLRSLRDAQPDGHGDFVFSLSNGQRPVSNFGRLRLNKNGKSKKGYASLGRFERTMMEVLKTFGITEIEGWVWHDVRRTVRTHLEPITGRVEIAEAAIGHAKEGVVRVYNLFTYRPQIRRAFNTWSALLKKIELGTCSIAEWEHDEYLLEVGSR